MIRWPWVGRQAYEDAVARERWLREQNERLTDALIRLARKEHGMPEAPREPHRPKPPDLPIELEREVQAIGSPHIQQVVRAGLRERMAAGKSAGDLLREMRAEREGTQP